MLQEIIERTMGLPDGAPLSAADRRELLEAMAEHPAVAVLPLLLLRHSEGLDDATLADLRNRVALLAADRRTLAFAAYGDDWANFYPEAAEQKMETVDVIDTFLSTYGNCSPEEEALLERMIFNPTPDYAEMLAREEQETLPPADDAPAGSDDALINAFIRSHHPAVNRPELMPTDAPDSDADQAPIARPEHADDSLLSESLAKIFIKQGRYERAYEIISSLNLKFPKKSAYFADQLRFLQKLIINRRCLEAEKAAGKATE